MYHVRLKMIRVATVTAIKLYFKDYKHKGFKLKVIWKYVNKCSPT